VIDWLTLAYFEGKKQFLNVSTDANYFQWNVAKTCLKSRWISLDIHLFICAAISPCTQDWLRTKAKQGWAWLVPGWETFWESQVAAGRGVSEASAHPVVCVGPNTPV